MLPFLDALIGFALVMLVFSLAATAIIQVVLSVLQIRGLNLFLGIGSLLRQIDPGLSRRNAWGIAWAVVSHPLVARTAFHIGDVIHREELVQLLLRLAAEAAPRRFFGGLRPGARAELKRILTDHGIPDPLKTAKEISDAAWTIGAEAPKLLAHERDTKAIQKVAATPFVAEIFMWFDSTIDRVSQAFSGYAGIVSLVVAAALAFATQLDAIQLVNRLTMDKDLRAKLVTEARTVVQKRGAEFDSAAAAVTGPGSAKASPKTVAPSAGAASDSTAKPPGKPDEALRASMDDLQMLAAQRLITLPWDPGSQAGPKLKFMSREWLKHRLGVLISTVLIALGAPFWFNSLKQLLSLRSSLAAKDDDQRRDRTKGSTATA